MIPADFIAMIAPYAQEIATTSKIPASFTIAQAALESAWFNSALARQAFNLFGIKADSSWKGQIATMPTVEFVDGRRITIDAAFRKYSSLADGLKDHSSFLTENPRYSKAFLLKSDACKFTQAIADAGYATDPQYAQSIISIIHTHNLERYD